MMRSRSAETMQHEPVRFWCPYDQAGQGSPDPLDHKECPPQVCLQSTLESTYSAEYHGAPRLLPMISTSSPRPPWRWPNVPYRVHPEWPVWCRLTGSNHLRLVRSCAAPQVG